MSDRTDQKLESVVLAQFHYRYEAEFAAGFLDDAGIPYRLQVDDAGMGLMISTPATLWVRGMDLRQGQEILDLSASPEEGSSDGGTSAPLGALPRGKELVTGDVEWAIRPAAAGGSEALTGQERALAFTLFVGCAGGAAFVLTASGGFFWVAALAALAGPLGTGAFVGRTIGPIRRLLRAISGAAP